MYKHHIYIMKSIAESNFHQVTKSNGEQAFPCYDHTGDGWVMAGWEFMAPSKWASEDDFGGTFTKEEADRILAAEPEAVATPLTVDQLKAIVIGEISDRSKERDGFRWRLSSADHTLTELEEKLKTLY